MEDSFREDAIYFSNGLASRYNALLITRVKYDIFFCDGSKKKERRKERKRERKHWRNVSYRDGNLSWRSKSISRDEEEAPKGPSRYFGCASLNRSKGENEREFSFRIYLMISPSLMDRCRSFNEVCCNKEIGEKRYFFFLVVKCIRWIILGWRRCK